MLVFRLNFFTILSHNIVKYVGLSQLFLLFLYYKNNKNMLVYATFL